MRARGCGDAACLVARVAAEQRHAGLAHEEDGGRDAENEVCGFGDAYHGAGVEPGRHADESVAAARKRQRGDVLTDTADERKKANVRHQLGHQVRAKARGKARVPAVHLVADHDEDAEHTHLGKRAEHLRLLRLPELILLLNRFGTAAIAASRPGPAAGGRSGRRCLPVTSSTSAITQASTATDLAAFANRGC